MTFDEFWTQYPRKTAKMTAQKAWAKVAESDHQAIVAGLTRAASSRQWRDGIIPHAATWLRQRRWEDEHSVQEGPTKAQRFLAEYRRRTGWWCRHVPSCEDLESCDDRIVSTWRARGVV